jgi:cysteine synthase A
VAEISKSRRSYRASGRYDPLGSLFVAWQELLSIPPDWLRTEAHKHRKTLSLRDVAPWLRSTLRAEFPVVSPADLGRRLPLHRFHTIQEIRMSNWYADNSLSIGRTPLIRLNRIADGATGQSPRQDRGTQPRLFGQVSHRCCDDLGCREARPAGPGKELVEPTSGNTGIALAFVAAARGIPLTLTMPETMSLERRKLLVAYGAKLILTEGAKGMGGAIARPRKSPRRTRIATCCCSNSRTPPTRRFTRAPPAPRSGMTPTAIDIFVSGVGTGGTITGVSRYIKNTRGKPIVSVAVEPSASPVLTQTLAGEALKPGPHKIQGIGAGFVPQVLDLSLVDVIEQVSNEEAVEYARRLAREEGILSGISCGAAVAAAVRHARKPENAGKTIVVVLPDSGERYLSSVLFDGVFDATGQAL